MVVILLQQKIVMAIRLVTKIKCKWIYDRWVIEFSRLPIFIFILGEKGLELRRDGASRYPLL